MTTLDTANTTHSALQTSREKLAALRLWLTSTEGHGFLIPTSDAHLNEYVLEWAKRREWLSGFDGSAGEALVTLEGAWLFVDGRYHQQADEQVDLSLWTLVKLGQTGALSLKEQLTHLAKTHRKETNPEETNAGFTVFADATTFTMTTWQGYSEALKAHGGNLKPVSPNPIDVLRGFDRHSPSQNLTATIESIGSQVAGASVAEKLAQVRLAMSEAPEANRGSYLPIVRLDDLCWLLNLRGSDIPYNPVFVGYGLVTPDRMLLFTDSHRLSPKAKADLATEVDILPYEAFGETLIKEVAGQQVLLDPQHLSQQVVQWLEESPSVIKVAGTNPIQPLKAVKTNAELQGMVRAHEEASLALIKAWHWAETQWNNQQPFSERAFSDQVEACYAESPAFRGLSFNTIAGFAENAAIIHYGTPSDEKVYQDGDFLLFDSGAQYWDGENPGEKSWAGTTDTTRTIAFGSVTPRQKTCYTAVLQAHINCARQYFPQGTTGIQLDAITRSDLWQHGLDFLHGTGHGVGAFLNVHEGPNGISNRNTFAMKPGMITSIEPGYYEAGWGGIRLENLYEVVDTGQTVRPTQEKLLGFSSLTLVPFDAHLVDFEMLTQAQQQWLERYHRRILDVLSLRLSTAMVAWLTAKCDMFLTP